MQDAADFFEDKKNRDCDCGILWSLNVLTHLSTARKPWTIPEKYLTKTIQPCTGRMQSLLASKEDADALESPEVKSAFELYRLKSWLSCLIHFDPDL